MYASQNPGDPSARRKCRSQPQEDRSPASNVHFGRGEGPALLITNPPRAQTREPASCTSMHTARGAPRINSSTFGRGGHPDTHDPPAWRRARPGPADRPSDRVVAPERLARPGAHHRRSVRQVGEALGRQVEHAGAAAGHPRPGPPGGGRRASARRKPNPWPGTRTVRLPGTDGPSAEACHTVPAVQSLPVRLEVIDDAVQRDHPAGAVAGCRAQGSTTTRRRPHAVRRGHRDGGRCPDLQEDAPTPQGGARRRGGYILCLRRFDGEQAQSRPSGVQSRLRDPPAWRSSARDPEPDRETSGVRPFTQRTVGQTRARRGGLRRGGRVGRPCCSAK